ncbi:MAG: NAD(P)-binding protein [Lachnospiraceae bacterium]|jgi:uncharacterized FAD-dependent dehydrogenase|nr:NAD(P)-binding protein [Lachnospiraceae bacterium]
MIRIAQCKRPVGDTRSIEEVAADYLRVSVKEILRVHIRRRSIDARKKTELMYVYCLDVEAQNERELIRRHGRRGVTEAPRVRYCFPDGGTERLRFRPVIVGAGPAGLFAAWELARHGYRPLILERGQDVDTRQRDVESFWQGGPLNPESNVQFGEGGAGTFSDGKLNTMVKDPAGRIRRVLETFVECGADPEILYDSRPHIGTDCLRQVVRTLRGRILEAGGEIRFGCRLTDLELGKGRLCGLICEEKGKKVLLETEVCILAVGHSARDVFGMLTKYPAPLEAKAFAVGFRIEHPQAMIQESQYGSGGKVLPAASYKVTAQTSFGRGVYSFCMCPGGSVVNASSEKGLLAVNGMSAHARDGRNANSAVVVTVQPQDFVRWQNSDSVLAGMEFQRNLERRAWEQASGRVPVQLFGDYRSRRASTGLGEVKPDIRGEYGLASVREILPQELGDAIEEGILSFGTHVRGFDREDAILSGVESRTSSPVRVLRDKNMESALRGLYPCGEGAGYAGGITSAAVDGLKMAETIVSRYARPD